MICYLKYGSEIQVVSPSYGAMHILRKAAQNTEATVICQPEYGSCLLLASPVVSYKKAL